VSDGKEFALKSEIPVGVVVIIVLVVLAGLGFFAYRQATPRAPAGARPAAAGIRESLSQELGRPVGRQYNPKGPD
jgi:hypothetical protein